MSEDYSKRFSQWRQTAVEAFFLGDGVTENHSVGVHLSNGRYDAVTKKNYLIAGNMVMFSGSAKGISDVVS